MYGRKVLDEFSKIVEEVRDNKKYQYLYEALLEVIESKEFEFITLSNVQQYINKPLKEKLFLEASKNNMIKKKYKKSIKTFF